MAYFAQLDENNVVMQVIAVENSELETNFGESEQKGIEFCKHCYGKNTRWVQTSFNGNIRKRFAGAGFIYDETLDAFIPPKVHSSWILDAETLNWKPPVNIPIDGKSYDWDESTLSWVELPPEIIRSFDKTPVVAFDVVRNTEIELGTYDGPPYPFNLDPFDPNSEYIGNTSGWYDPDNYDPEAMRREWEERKNNT